MTKRILEFFEWSYWDPIGRINELPVALVNSDEGTTVTAKDGKTTQLNAGEEVTKKLLDNDKVTFTLVDGNAARQGVADGTYYFAIELPADFSEAAASAAGDHPRQATVNTLFNNDNGLIATTLGNQVVTQVLATMNSGLGEKVTDQLLVGFNTVGSGLGKAADGAGKLADGTQSAKDGSGKLDDGAAQLADGIVKADEGANTLADGAQRLADGASTAAGAADELSAGLSQLEGATARLGDGATQVSGGVDQIHAKAAQVTSAQEELIVPLINISTSLRATGNPEAVRIAGEVDNAVETLRTQGVGPESELKANLDKLQAGAAEIARQLSDPNAEYASGMHRAAEGSAQLATGLHTLSDGSQQLVVGTRTLADGTSKLVAGSEQLTVGARQLSDGLVELDAGSEELALKLKDSGSKVPNFPDNTRENTAGTMSTPVTLKATGDTLPLFGLGLSPMFISLGLFMGATVSWMVMRPLQRRAVDSGVIAPRVVLASYIPAAIVGISQATVMFLVQKYALGVVAFSEWGMWAAMCLAAVVFQMVTLGINAAVGATVGRVVCIALMSLQIVSSGGLYPPETQPAFLRWFHHYDPMTYTVNLLRQMIFHADTTIDPRVAESLTALGIIFFVFAALATLGAAKARRMAMKDLHPEVSV